MIDSLHEQRPHFVGQHLEGYNRRSHQIHWPGLDEMKSSHEMVLAPRSGWQPIASREIYEGRELFWFLILRDIKIRYKQTVLGGFWAILQPLLAMLIFTVFFNRFAGIGSDGVPYPLFAYSGLALWTFFANSISMSSNSLVGNQTLVSKVYFPRMFIPLASIGALLLDLAVSLALMTGIFVYYRWPVNRSIVWVPFFILGTMLAAAGIGLGLSALNVRFRDVKYAVPFFVQMGLFLTPVIYPLRYVPERYQLMLGLNPMAGMVVGFRHSLFGGPVNWLLVGLSFLVSVIVFVAGIFIFRRVERQFSDVI